MSVSASVTISISTTKPVPELDTLLIPLFPGAVVKKVKRSKKGVQSLRLRCYASGIDELLIVDTLTARAKSVLDVKAQVVVKVTELTMIRLRARRPTAKA
jgi:hypothetical protein